MKRYQRFNGNVKLILVDCGGATVDDNPVSSQGQVDVTGSSANSCKLKAQVMNGNDPIREGESSEFTIPSAFRQMEKI